MALHVKDICSRCAQRFYLLTVLKKSGFTTQQLVIFYNAKIRSLLSYAFPAMANMLKMDQAKLVRVERRAYNIIGCSPKTSLCVFQDGICRKLVQSITSNKHWLSDLFLWNYQKNVLVPPCAKTSRYCDSFLKYAA